MFGRSCPLIVLPPLLLAGAACNKELTTTDVHMARMAEVRNSPRAHYSYMVDNAVANDMSVADFHFVGHTSELSGTGVARLDRLASFLDAYGGTVRYETYLTAADLVEERLAHVREYLALAGCDMDRVEVTTMISGGRGMPAAKAIEIEDRGTKPEGGDAGAAPLGAPMGG